MQTRARPAPVHPASLRRRMSGILAAIALLVLSAGALAAQSGARGGASRATRVGAAHPAPDGGEAHTLVSVQWLADHLNDPELVVLHVGDEAEYRKAHIPGARYVSFHDLAMNGHGAEPGLTLEMLPMDELRSRLEALGISDGSRVVVYFGQDWVTPATRVLFALDAVRPRAFASLLDGGMPGWIRAGRPVTTADPPPATRGHITPLRPAAPVVDARWIMAHEQSPGVAIVDARGRVFYDGVEPSNGVRGHIPGAHSIPFSSVVDDSLKLRPRAELEALFLAAGVGPRDTVAAYCHIGQQATLVYFAARLLGHPAFLYDGSMQDWARRDLPVTAAAAARAEP